MRKQSGFGATGVILLVIAVGLIGFSGWTVWKSSKSSKDTSNQTANPTPRPTDKIDDKPRQAPDGYSLYDNKDFGFSFFYPKAWGNLSPISSPTSALDLEGPNVPVNKYDKSKLSVWADKTAIFKTRSNNRGPNLSPSLESGVYIWKHAVDYHGVAKAGETYSRQPELLTTVKNAKVYKFGGGHACSSEALYMFPAGDKFVGIMIDYSSCYDLQLTDAEKSNRPQFEKSIDDLEAEITKLATTIEVK